MNYDDTIAAIATASGEGAIGIVRLSGTDAAAIAAKCFRLGRGRRTVDPAQLESHRLHYGSIVDPGEERTIDEVMLVLMASPRSYTREDVIEISCHGGPASVSEILGVCLRLGARAAEPGEFTLRAFINGRIDLAQAESVAAIVSARTSRALDLAVRDLRGRLSARLRPARDNLVEALAYLDAAADFPDDEIPPFDLDPALTIASQSLSEVLRAAELGLLFREGIRVAIVGRPNVGKSSLLNALLRSDRAIVTPIAGTTRDVISEQISLRGIPATLLDTAGIDETEDVIEQLGIDRSRQALDTSGIVVFVVDRSQPLTHADRRVANLIAGTLEEASVVVVLNKSDLPTASAETALMLPGARTIELSATTGYGISDLEDELYSAAVARSGEAADPALVSVRQLDALRRATASVEAATWARHEGIPLDLIAIDVRDALEAVGEITGERVSEAVLDEIFRRFCIGK